MTILLTSFISKAPAQPQDRCIGESCKCPAGMTGVQPFCRPIEASLGLTLKHFYACLIMLIWIDAEMSSARSIAVRSRSFIWICLKTRPDTRQSSRGWLGRSSNAKTVRNSKMWRTKSRESVTKNTCSIYCNPAWVCMTLHRYHKFMHKEFRHIDGWSHLEIPSNIFICLSCGQHGPQPEGKHGSKEAIKLIWMSIKDVVFVVPQKPSIQD